ncbi:class I SAM-dependent methyltransferase [Streptomyces syringium]|uniref:class I SAM-dependent methyltransferase n=1 Tax=Streptomyces syringium TaxID=76729 RepID=UPI0033DF46AF
MTTAADLAPAYSEDNIILRVTGHLGLPDLINMGYYTLMDIPRVVRQGLGPFQRSLATRSLRLLDARPGHRVLDACCGRGDTTAALATMGCGPLGVDLQPEQIRRARQRFPHLADTFVVADVTTLPNGTDAAPFAQETFDRIHCLEAAFHFGGEGRSAFLDTSFRLLKPGGRLVLVDFTWMREETSIAEADPDHLVRRLWHFEDFEPLDGYLEKARRTGFTVHHAHDWTVPALRRPVRLSTFACRAAATAWGRAALCRRWPGLEELPPSAWSELLRAFQAHNRVSRAAGYHALVLDKPAGTAHDPGSGPGRPALR